MATVAYHNSEGNTPPSYNEQTPSPPAQVSHARAPSQANIKYVDQNGNPVNPPIQRPAANIQYVDQYGNPVAAPIQQPAAPVVPNAQYVDQYGNPVAAPVPVQAKPPISNVKYVDQYGNPVAAPTSAPIQQPAVAVVPNVKYVDQYGNPVTPPTNVQTAPPAAPNVKYVDQHGNPVSPPSNAAKPEQYVCWSRKPLSAVLGAIALLIFVIGLVVDSLATYSSSSSSFSSLSYSVTCGWTEFRLELGDSDSDTSYSELCDAQTAAELSSGNSDGASWCGTQTSASLSLLTMIGATILCLFGIVFVQPWCNVRPCCCRTNPHWSCARTSFVFCVAFSILSLIIWSVGDEVCMSSDDIAGFYNMGMGGSMICQIIALIFAVIAAIFAKQ